MPVDAAVIADKVQRVLAAVPAEQACDPGYVAHTIRAEAGGIMSDVEVLSVLRKLRWGRWSRCFPFRGLRMCW